MQLWVKDWKKILLYKLTWEPFKILGLFAEFRGPSLSFTVVLPPGTTRITLGIYSWYFIEKFYSKSVEKIQAGSKSDENTNTLFEDLNRFIIISRWILPRIKKFHIKPVEQIKAGSHVSHKLHFSRSRAVYEIITQTAAQSDRQQTIVRDRVQRILDLHAGYLRQIYIS
jgi:hypothetical protein